MTMTMTVPLQWPKWLPYERRRLIANIAGAIVVVTAAGFLVYRNFMLAQKTFKQPRLRICAVYARELEKGRVLQANDVILRMRRPILRDAAAKKALSEYFQGTTQLTGRQIQKVVHRDDVIYEDAFIPPRTERVLFAVSVDRASAMTLFPDGRVVLVPHGEQDQLRRWPEFRIVECLDVDKLKDSATTASLKLEADSAVDAMRVLAAATANAKLVPLVVKRGDPGQCKN